MLTQVLRWFHGYTLDTILEIPFSHFMLLFQMAERIEKHNTLTIVAALGAQYDKASLDNLLAVEGYKMQTEKVYKRIATEEAKEYVKRFVQK